MQSMGNACCPEKAKPAWKSSGVIVDGVIE
eukprot:COSAG06_NODE_29933_length_548_cov_0.652561_1_plen_29_part_10